jgi:endonuclease/exonuclease/phosphatase family metal-dependent hydrolase
MHCVVHDPSAPLIALAVVLAAALPAAAEETFTVATWNIENWHTNFEGHRMRQATRPATRPVTEEQMEVMRQEGYQNDEDHWEVAQVVQDPAFSPDVLVVQEGATKSDLEFFNKRWLDSAYATVVQFPSNTDRNQHLNLLLKPGFKLVERRDQYYKDPDAVPNDRGNRLFARGPAFALVETPGGYRFWVGTTHQKSKQGGDNPAWVQWRNREALRTHQIMRELERTGPNDVILLGDMNDTLGVDELEADNGGDPIANLVGPPEDGFALATKPLADKKEFSYGGYWRTDHRSLIDHVVVSGAMKDQVKDVRVLKTPLASVASDHYPVVVTLRADEPSAASTTRPASNTRFEP